MNARRWTRLGHLGVVGLTTLALSACGDDPTPTADPAGFDAVELPPVDDSTVSEVAEIAPVPADVGAAVTQRAEGAPLDASPARALQELDQPAIWPAADVVFATPQEAAADFVAAVLISEGDPLLGEFQVGDNRSGEIPVLFAGETADLDPPIEAGLLLLRQLGPTDGWYVIAAVSEGARIDSPAALDEVAAGPVTVSGEGRGFEGTLAVSAFPPGDADAAFDLQIGAGGAFDEVEPFSVELDLSGASPGDVVVVLVSGDTGLGNDPSTFAALPIVIAAAPPATIPASR